MALFKPFRGNRASLDAQELHDGYAYFCTDDGSFHIDYVDDEGNLQRKQINAKEAETLGLYTADEFVLKEELQIPITWAELKQLRDDAQLISGQFYRITDYVCTTVQENTRAMSNQFDIIVQALSTNTISENASADYHYEDGELDGHFLKLDVSGGNTLKSGAVTAYYYVYEDFEGGSETPAEYKTEDGFVAYGYEETPDGDVVPVIYKTNLEHAAWNPEEYGSPDYKDIFYYIGTETIDGATYDKWRKISSEDGPYWDGSTGYIYCYTNVVVENNAIIGNVINSNLRKMANIPAWELKYSLDNDTNRFAWADEENGKGVIYWMKDEHNNECPYDFKNIQFKRDIEWQSQHKNFIKGLGLNTGDIEWFYTFSWVNESIEVEDLTIKQDLVTDESIAIGTYNNIINIYQEDGLLRLSRNVIVNSFQYDNGYFQGCYGNAFRNNCYDNTFGNRCCENTFGRSCSNNIFYDCVNNNIFSDCCFRNIFANDCGFNTFGNKCMDNTFGRECSYNTFGNNCSYNTFGNNCKKNIFGRDCHHLKTTDSSWDGMISTGNNFLNNVVGNECCYLYFDISESSANSNIKAQRNKFHDGISGTVTKFKTIYCRDNTYWVEYIPSGTTEKILD